MVSLKSFVKLALLATCLYATPAISQINFKLQWLQDSTAWGVFATPDEGVSPSEYLIIGSGQVTLVAPPQMQFNNLKSFSGTWVQNSYVGTPIENPNKDYISFGLEQADPPMQFRAGEETLLFTFSSKEGECPDELYLMSNDDPFNVMPNSKNSNPGNDISILDPGNDKSLYFFSKVYAPDAWDCHPGKQKAQGPFISGYEKRRNRRQLRP
jgi:pSer/pThr/pTyr-binding forkhead associated (FHA) protein